MSSLRSVAWLPAAQHGSHDDHDDDQVDPEHSQQRVAIRRG
jgi:hypothetical protein